MEDLFDDQLFDSIKSGVSNVAESFTQPIYDFISARNAQLHNTPPTTNTEVQTQQQTQP